jgi:hypothetical protein
MNVISKLHKDRSYIQIYKPYSLLKKKTIPWKRALFILVCVINIIVFKKELKKAIITKINRFIEIRLNCLKVSVRY